MILTTIDRLAAHLGALARASNVTMTRESTIMPAATFHWDAVERLVSVRAPIAEAFFAGLEPRELALRVSMLNRRLEVVGLEATEDVAFVSHAFFDGEGVPAAAIDRLIRAVADCERIVLESKP